MVHSVSFLHTSTDIVSEAVDEATDQMDAWLKRFQIQRMQIIEMTGSLSQIRLSEDTISSTYVITLLYEG